jgi:hypothetical protein
MPVSTFSRYREAYYCYQLQSQFLAGNAEKIISHGIEWAFRYQFFATGCP